MPGPVRRFKLSTLIRTRQVGSLLGDAVKKAGEPAGCVTSEGFWRTVKVICFGLPRVLARKATTSMTCGPTLLGVQDRMLSIEVVPFASGEAAVSTLRLSTRISTRVTPTLSTARTYTCTS